MRLILLIVAALLLAGCIPGDFGPSDRFTADFHYTLKPSGRLSVENFNGEIEIAGWDEPSIEVTGVKYASTREGLNNIDIHLHESAALTEIRTVRPDMFLGNRGARFLIRAPRGTAIDRAVSSNGAIRIHGMTAPARIHTSNGAIRVEDVSGSVDAGTSNGPITLRFEGAPDGPVRIKTSNGSVDVTMSKSPKNSLTAETSNGSITLDVPGNTAARVNAQTSRSSISSEFAVEMSASAAGVSRYGGKRHLEGNIGAGGPLIELTTRNGGIHIRRSSVSAN